MSFEFKEIANIARASLMPDFFAVRIAEEGLFAKMQEMIGKISFPKPIAQLDAIKQIAIDSADATTFTQTINSRGLWSTLRELLMKAPIG